MNNPLSMEQASEMEEMVEVFYTSPVVFMKRVPLENRAWTTERVDVVEKPGRVNSEHGDRVSS